MVKGQSYICIILQCHFLNSCQTYSTFEKIPDCYAKKSRRRKLNCNIISIKFINNHWKKITKYKIGHETAWPILLIHKGHVMCQLRNGYDFTENKNRENYPFIPPSVYFLCLFRIQTLETMYLSHLILLLLQWNKNLRDLVPSCIN